MRVCVCVCVYVRMCACVCTLELCDNGKSYISIMEDNLNKIILINDIISIMSLHDYLQDFRLLLYLSVSHSHLNQARSIPQVKTAVR